jgi:hypothetical protein
MDEKVHRRGERWNVVRMARWREKERMPTKRKTRGYLPIATVEALHVDKAFVGPIGRVDPLNRVAALVFLIPAGVEGGRKKTHVKRPATPPSRCRDRNRPLDNQVRNHKQRGMV